MYPWPNMYFVCLRETGSSGLGYVRKVRQSAHDLAFSVQQPIVVLNFFPLANHTLRVDAGKHGTRLGM